DRFLREAAILEQVVAPLRSGRRGELLAKVGECELVHLDERLALRRRFALLAALFQLRNRDAEACRERAHGFTEIDLVLQLDELEHVAAGVAAEARSEPFVLVDSERRCFLAVKGAEALVLRAGLAQRHGI